MPKYLKFILFLLMLFTAFKVLAFFSDSPENAIDFSTVHKKISLNDNGLEIEIATSKNTLQDFFEENKLAVNEYDEVIPSLDTTIYPGINIEIRRALKIKIEVDGKKIENYTLEKNIEKIITENNIKLGRLDKVSPNKNSALQKDVPIIITRINVEEKIIPEDIDFKITTKTDSKLGWREKKTQQKGEKGIKEIKYEITYKNSREVSRKVLEKNITKDPMPEIIVQGTFVKLGKKHTGLGTWYAWKGGLYAASPWLPMGSFAKVTNVANGKSVIVEINDRGPFGKNRIIDLDKVAFQKIASLGAGVIETEVEEVLN